MSNTRARTGRSEGIAARSAASVVGVAARVEQVPDGRSLEPGGELGAGAASRRVDHDEVGDVVPVLPPRWWRRRPRTAPGRRPPPRWCGPRRTASAATSTPMTGRPVAARCSAKPPTPQYRSHALRPRQAVAVQAAASRYSAAATAVLVWKKPGRTQVQGEAVHPHRQRAAEQHLDLLAVEHRGVARLQVGRHHPQVRQPLAQPRQVLAQPRQRLGGAQHEPGHQLAVGGGRHHDVLELAGARRHVVRGEAGAGDQLGEHRQGVVQDGLVQAAAAQVGAVPGGVEDAEGRGVHRAGDDHLGLVAERRPRRRSPAAATPGRGGRPAASGCAACLAATCSSYGRGSQVHDRHTPAS